MSKFPIIYFLCFLFLDGFSAQAGVSTIVNHYQLQVPINDQTMSCIFDATLLSWQGFSNISHGIHKGLSGNVNGSNICYAQNWILFAQKSNGFLTADIEVRETTSCEAIWYCDDPLNGSTCVNQGLLYVKSDRIYLKFREAPGYDFLTDDNGIIFSKMVSQCP